MLNIQIDDRSWKKKVRHAYGDDSQSIANAFLYFIRQQGIKRDIRISINQLDAGEGLPLEGVMEGTRSKY